MYDFINEYVDPQINSSLYSYIFKRGNIFSFIDFLTNIFTLHLKHHSVHCGVVYQIILNAIFIQNLFKKNP